MNLANEIRRTVLSGYGIDIRNLLLSDNLIELYWLIESGGISTSSQLSEVGGITPANAHGKMKHLFDAGYVQRNKVVTSGGMEYFYHTTQEKTS